MESPLFLGLGSDRSVSIFVQALMVVSMTTPQCGVLHWWQGGLVVHQHPSLSVTPKKCHHLHIVNTSLSIDFLSLPHTRYFTFTGSTKNGNICFIVSTTREKQFCSGFFLISNKKYIPRVLPLHIWCRSIGPNLLCRCQHELIQQCAAAGRHPGLDKRGQMFTAGSQEGCSCVSVLTDRWRWWWSWWWLLNSSGCPGGWLWWRCRWWIPSESWAAALLHFQKPWALSVILHKTRRNYTSTQQTST